jgi:hypothetical protein
MLQLQGTIGNRALGQLLTKTTQDQPANGRNSSADTDTVQRFVTYMGVGGRVKKATVNWLFGKFKQNYGDAYSEAQKNVGDEDQKLMDDEAIEAFLKRYVDDLDRQYAVDEVCKLLEKEIQRKKAQHQFVPGLNKGGIEVEFKGQENTFPQPLDIKQEDDKVDLHPNNNILITPKVAVKLPPDQLDQWTIGLTQTLLSSHRRIRFVSFKGIRTVTIDVNDPHNDRRPGTPPWYDNLRSKQDLTGEFELIDNVYLDDKPGFDLSKHRSENILESTGQDLFKTWLILRHTSGDPIHFLYVWSWNVTYTTGGGADLTGAPTDRTAGEEAKLDGARATEDYTANSEAIEWDDLPTRHQYKNMKSKATKWFTPGSGMLSTKDYGRLVNQFYQHVGRNEFKKAGDVLAEIKQGLDLMDNQGSKYWKSSTLKTTHFQPIYDAVDKLITDIAAL